MQIVLNCLWIFVISSVLKQTCKAHECFQCRSDVDKDCAIIEPPKIYRKPCVESVDGYCRKTTFTLYFTGNNQPVVVRECVEQRPDTLPIEEGCYFGRYTRDSNSVTCECRGDCCNGTHPSTKSIITSSVYDYVLLQLVIQLALL